MRIISKISVGALAFVIGVAAAAMWLKSPPPQPRQSEVIKPSLPQEQPTSVSVCELQREADLYEGKFVEVRGVMYNVKGKLLLYGGCSDPVGFTWVDTSELGELDEGIKALADSNPSRAPKNEADVTVIGTAHKYANGEFLLIRIVPSKIELRSPLRKFKPKGAA